MSLCSHLSELCHLSSLYKLTAMAATPTADCVINGQNLCFCEDVACQQSPKVQYGDIFYLVCKR